MFLNLQYLNAYFNVSWISCSAFFSVVFCDLCEEFFSFAFFHPSPYALAQQLKDFSLILVALYEAAFYQDKHDNLVCIYQVYNNRDHISQQLLQHHTASLMLHQFLEIHLNQLELLMDIRLHFCLIHLNFV